jgi:hypothetical protein
MFQNQLLIVVQYLYTGCTLQYSTGNVYFDKNACLRCSIFPMGDISRGADTLLTAVFGEHPKSPRLHAIINWNTRDHRNAARPLIHVIPVCDGHSRVLNLHVQCTNEHNKLHVCANVCVLKVILWATNSICNIQCRCVS